MMRRGTPAAYLFGGNLFEIRKATGISMRQVAEKLGEGYFASTVSQVEKGQRVVKEERLDSWAAALGVSNAQLRRLWRAACETHPPSPIVRKRSKSAHKSDLEDLFRGLTSSERDRVRGYIDALIESR
jgi:transcriptional regulator with XRE-family HTH domain